jgi:hypothetical protein
MAGTISTPIFVQDGQYLTFVAETAVTLGQVVYLVNTGTPSTVSPATAAVAGVIGVAITGNRISKVATDDVVAAGDRVTVLTRGVANLVAGTGGVTVGKCVAAGVGAGAEPGRVDDIDTSLGAADDRKIVGRALQTAAAAATAQILVNVH